MTKFYAVTTIEAMELLLNSLTADPRKPGEPPGVPPADFEDDPEDGDDDEPDDDEDDDEEAA